MKELNLAITICATKNYCYAMKTLARRVSSNISLFKKNKSVKEFVIIAGDNSQECLSAVSYWKKLFSDVIHLNVLIEDETAKNYKETAQLTISKLRDAAFTEARRLDADFCWSLDSDTLPPSNALRCMFNTLEFDDGYYQVSSCPYPNTEFLGGFGTYQNQIAEDFLPSERKLPDDLKEEIKTNEEEVAALNKEKKEPSKEQLEKWENTRKKINECPPDGNIWEVIAKHGWRRRGWMSSAYPAMGLGTSCVPVDWHGCGCLLMGKTALSYALFDGYEGKGTEDLYMMWNYFHPNGIRMNTVPHCLCDHVIATRKKGAEKNEYQHIISYHEREGEYRGHPRTRTVKWNGD